MLSQEWIRFWPTKSTFKQSWKPCRRALLRQLRGQLFLRFGPWTRGVRRRVVGREAAEKEKPVDLCRYFMKAGGCKQGSRCSYSHSMQSLDKDLRSKKCLACGSESHRQRDCPVARGGQRQKGGGGSPIKDGKGPEQRPSGGSSTAATVASVQDPVQGVPWTSETLVQAAQQVIQGQPAAPDGESSPEKTKTTGAPEMRTLVGHQDLLGSGYLGSFTGQWGYALLEKRGQSPGVDGRGEGDGRACGQPHATDENDLWRNSLDALQRHTRWDLWG